jgi:hypothetical protein
MLLGGLWHGAGWTFVAWGGLHGAYLVINHGWRALLQRMGRSSDAPTNRTGRVLGLAITFLAVTVAWVFFRSTSFEAAIRILSSMARLPELTALDSPEDFVRHLSAAQSSAVSGWRQLVWTAGMLCVAFFAPNSQQIVTAAERWCVARGLTRGRDFAFATGSLLADVCLLAAINGSRGVSEFIYFNF